MLLDPNRHQDAQAGECADRLASFPRPSRAGPPPGDGDGSLTTYCCRSPHDTGWTAVDPKQPFGLDERGEVFNGSLHRIVALLARHILDRGTNRFGHRL